MWVALFVVAAIFLAGAVFMAALARMASLADRDMPTPDGSPAER